jgi:hypothetical protein
VRFLECVCDIGGRNWNSRIKEITEELLIKALKHNYRQLEKFARSF